MRKLAVAVALASTALASPAMARDNSWYVGVGGGVMLVEDMEARGPVRLAEVEAAQKEILAIVRKMAEDGTIQLAVKAEVFV